jgi:hypothetical protein
MVIVACDRQYRRDQPQRDAQQHDAEERLHVLHPATGARQQRPGGQPEQQQRHAHAGGQGEQGGAAEHHVARLADVDQRARQRRGHAWPHQQRRQPAHREHRDVAAAGEPVRGFVHARLDEARHLEFP